MDRRPKNPFHPGEILLEEFLEPMGHSHLYRRGPSRCNVSFNSAVSGLCLKRFKGDLQA